MSFTAASAIPASAEGGYFIPQSPPPPPPPPPPSPAPEPAPGADLPTQQLLRALAQPQAQLLDLRHPPPLADLALLLATPAQAAALLHGQPTIHPPVPATEPAAVSEASVPALAAALRQRGVRAVLLAGGQWPHSHWPADPDWGSHDWLDTPHARGWLSRPGPAIALRNLAHTAAAALAHGHVAADALVLARLLAACGASWPRPWPREGDPPSLPLNAHGLPTLSLPGQRPTAQAGLAFAPLPDSARPIGVYAVVDSAQWVQRVLAAGVRTVQLRIKDRHHPELLTHIRASIRAARAHGAQLYINDHWDLALQEGAWGVHLGQDDLPHADLAAIARAGLRLGVSTHSAWEVARARAVRPSYIACGPIHATASKAMPWLPQGNGNLAFWSALLPEPVVAIAGMDAARLAEAARHGAAGVALITAITAAIEPEAAIATLQAAWTSGYHAPRAQPPALPRPTLPADHIPPATGANASAA